jgi:hypothetical protein
MAKQHQNLLPDDRLLWDKVKGTAPKQPTFASALELKFLE